MKNSPALRTMTVLVGAMILLVSQKAYADATETHASAATQSSQEVEQLGQEIYLQRCASCHETGVERALPRSTLGAMNPASIMNALMDGPMQRQAFGLDLRGVVAVSEFVSENNVETSGETVSGPNKCSHRPKPLSLNAPSWNGWGAGEGNRRYQDAPGITAEEVANFELLWAVPLGGARNGQPTIVGSHVFVVNTAEGVLALDRDTGCSYWRYEAPVMARTTVTIGEAQDEDGGARLLAFFVDYGGGAHALDAQTGELVWRTKVDDQPSAVGTGSPTFHNNRLYVPVSSGESLYAASSDYPCCTFRGAVVALDAATGAIEWKTYTTSVEPEKTGTNAKGIDTFGPAGGAIWSAPTIDAERDVLYVGTGNRYTAEEHEGAEAILALSLSDGHVVWRQKMTNGLPSIMGCYFPPFSANCPEVMGGNHDFGASPILTSLGNGNDILLAAQKSGHVYGLDPDNAGAVVWQTRLGPGGQLGGIQFGASVEGTKLFAGVSDIFVREGAQPGLNALDINDGTVLWQTASASLPCEWESQYCHPGISQAVTSIPGIVLAGALNGWLRAYDSTNGRVVWEFNSGTKVQTIRGERQGGVLDGAGPVVADGMMFVTTGYAGRQGHSGSLLLAFSPKD